MPERAVAGIVQDQAHQLMKQVLALKDQRWVDESKITPLVDQLKIREPADRIYFLRELLAIVRRLPLKIYKDPEDRLRLIGAVQAALDVAVDAEEGESE